MTMPMKTAIMTATTTYILPMLRMKSASCCANKMVNGNRKKDKVASAFILALNMVLLLALRCSEDGAKVQQIFIFRKKGKKRFAKFLSGKNKNQDCIFRQDFIQMIKVLNSAEGLHNSCCMEKAAK